jgi:hypothetical protein
MRYVDMYIYLYVGHLKINQKILKKVGWPILRRFEDAGNGLREMKIRRMVEKARNTGE